MNIIDLDAKVQDPIFALIYGPSGSGKTHLVGTLGELGTVLVIDVDKGYKTLKTAKGLSNCRDNITVCTFDIFTDLNTAAQTIEKNDPELWNKTFKTPGQVKKPFDWVVWDTWSELQWHMLQELRKKENLLNRTLDFRKNIQIQHWGMMTDLNKLAIEQLRDCKSCNQVFTMQETMSKDEVSGVIHGGPAIHGKMVQEMPTYFDVVIHTGTDLAGNFTATTKKKGTWAAKTRLSEGKEYKNPRAKEIFTFTD